MSDEARLVRIEESQKNLTASFQRLEDKFDGAHLERLATTVALHDRVLWAIAGPALAGLGLSLWLLVAYFRG